MKKITTLTTLLVFLFLSANAQVKNGRITGLVKDANEKAVIAATVSLQKTKDSSVVKLAVTDKQGEFEFDKIAEGKYFVSVTAIGFKKAISNTLEINSINNIVALTDFQLSTASQSLGDVVVTAKRPLIENKIDRTVLNVEASVTNAGLTALDVLEKSPGVSIDNNGIISLKGKQGVIVLMDGKQTYLSGNDLATLLKNMPANQLDQIEIMTQPPAKYDASGNSGLINIKTKKSTQKGYNGSANISYIQAVYPKTTSNFNLNYRNNKINLFGNYSYSYWVGFSDINIDRYFGRDGNKFDALFDQFTFGKFISSAHSFRGGADYSITKKTTVGVAVNTVLNQLKPRGWGKSDLINSSNEIYEKNLAENRSRGHWNNYGVNLNLRHQIDKSGKEFSADLDFLQYDTKTKQENDNYRYDANGNLIINNNPGPFDDPSPFLLRGDLPSDIKIWSAKADYVSPFKKGGKLETGWKSSFVKTDNDARFTRIIDNVEEPDRRSNRFNYDENINAVYASYSRQFKKWGIQTGLRMEHTHAKGKQAVNNASFDTSYVQLFPTAYLSYAANKNNNFTLSYGRRIERPNYQDMNPFQFFLDQFTYRQGNPSLSPQFSHNVELAYNYKGQLNIAANFSHTNNVISDVLKQNDQTKVTYQTKENVSQRTNVGLSISYNKPITKWWTATAFANVFNNNYKGTVNGIKLNADITSYMFNSSSQFKFKKGWGAEVSGFYRSKLLVSGLIIGEPMGVVSFGASKQILKGKGSIRLNLNDPFWIQYFRGYTKFGNIDTRIQSKWDNRRIVINFTYRFSKGQNVQQRRRNGGAADEQNRVGQGAVQQ